MVHQCLSDSHTLAGHALLDDLIELVINYSFDPVGLTGLFVDIQLSIFDKDSLEDSLIFLQLLELGEDAFLFAESAAAFGSGKFLSLDNRQQLRLDVRVEYLKGIGGLAGRHEVLLHGLEGDILLILSSLDGLVVMLLALDSVVGSVDFLVGFYFVAVDGASFRIVL